MRLGLEIVPQGWNGPRPKLKAGDPMRFNAVVDGKTLLGHLPMELYRAAGPEFPRQVVAMRLREFLASSRDVDFGAQTTPRNGTVRFANKDYERKPSEWKLCYRVGEPAVRRARAFAET